MHQALSSILTSLGLSSGPLDYTFCHLTSSTRLLIKILTHSYVQTALKMTES